MMKVELNISDVIFAILTAGLIGGFGTYMITRSSLSLLLGIVSEALLFVTAFIVLLMD